MADKVIRANSSQKKVRSSTLASSVHSLAMMSPLTATDPPGPRSSPSCVSSSSSSSSTLIAAARGEGGGERPAKPQSTRTRSPPLRDRRSPTKLPVVSNSGRRRRRCRCCCVRQRRPYDNAREGTRSPTDAGPLSGGGACVSDGKNFDDATSSAAAETSLATPSSGT